MNQQYPQMISDDLTQTNSYYSSTQTSVDSQPLMTSQPIIVQPQYNQPPQYDPTIAYQQQYPQQYQQPYNQSFLERYIKYIYRSGFLLIVPWILIICLLKRSDSPDIQEYRRKSRRMSIIYGIIIAIVLIIALVIYGIAALSEYIENTDIDDVIF